MKNVVVQEWFIGCSADLTGTASRPASLKVWTGLNGGSNPPVSLVPKCMKVMIKGFL